MIRRYGEEQRLGPRPRKAPTHLYRGIPVYLQYERRAGSPQLLFVYGVHYEGNKRKKTYIAPDYALEYETHLHLIVPKKER